MCVFTPLRFARRGSFLAWAVVAWQMTLSSSTRLAAQTPATSEGRVDFTNLLQRIPDSANALVILQVESIFQSPLATAENWAGQYSDAFSAAPLLVPSRSARFVLGAEIDLETMKSQWEAAAMELTVDHTVPEIAARLGGVVDRLEGCDAIWLRQRLCIAKYSDRQFGVLIPANRQSAGRWIDHGKRARLEEFSPYLLRASRYMAGAGPEIVMALDLRDLLRPEALSQAVDRTALLRGLDTAEVATILASLQGVMMGVRVTDRLSGRLIVDFGVSAEPLTSVAKPLLLHVLNHAGAVLDEFPQWEATVKEKRIIFEGSLSTESVRRLFSIVSLDSSLVSEAPSAADPGANGSPVSGAKGEDPLRIARASLRYYRAVSKYVHGLSRGRGPNSLSQGALWVSNYARKIDQLPTGDVDPDLAACGQRISQRMRDAVAHVYDVVDDAEARASQIQPAGSVRVTAVPTSRRVNYGGYVTREYAPMATANLDISSALAKREALADQAYAAGLQTGQDLIDQNLVDWKQITQTMNERYPLEFGD